MVTNNIKGIIFDLDGTLIDSLADIATAANSVLEQFGFSAHPVEDYRIFVGDGVNVLMERIVPGQELNDEFKMKFLLAWKKEYSKQWNVQTRPYDGILVLVDELKKGGYRMGVLSNKPQEFTQACVAEYFKSDLIDPVWGLCEDRPKKPDPKGALEMAAQWELPPEEILYVGDTSTDMQTAVNAGMWPLGVSWGFRSKEELVAHGARAIIDQPMDLMKLLP
jgi:phosphoglycolate phosphatase